MAQRQNSALGRPAAGTGSLGVNRRTFMGGGAALGAAAMLATTLRPSAGLADDQPKRGGHLKIGLSAGSETDSLDPATFNTIFMQITGQQFYNQLVEVDSKLGLVPVLAESWDVKPGAKEWVFKIRKGVTFSNGQDLTAADVVFSLNHHRGPDSKSPGKVLLAPISELKASDKHEVTIALDNGNADLPYLLTSYLLCIGPDGGSFKDGLGTGSFIVEKFEPGIRLLSKRNPNNWRSDRGFADSVETLSVGDPGARLNGVISGSLDLINRVDARVAPMLQKSATVNLFSISGAGHDTFPMRTDIPPFNDPNLRLAMKYAIDRESMVQRVLNGFGRIGNDIPIPSFDPMFAADIPQRPFDPDKAGFYFKKANFSGPVVLSVSDEAFSGAVDAAQIFQQGAAKAGMQMEIKREPAATYWDDVWLKKPICASSWEGRPTADLMLTAAYTSAAPWNDTRWIRPQFDSLLVQARAELDVAKRKQLFHDLQLMIYEDGGQLIPMFNNFLDAGSKKLSGFMPMPSKQFSDYRAHEKVWFNS